MNRKQKIIVSITGIVIVVLALLGLTYAYFVTQIQGNENDKSIEVTTANLRLVYGDGNGSITASNIMPGTEISSKEFTVTNEGNAESSYITVFENILYTDNKTDPVTQINSFSRQEDLKYTLTCKQYNASDVETGNCDGVTDTIFPNATTMSLIVSNKIPVGYVHKYVLTLNYVEAGEDQSEDMGKGLSAKVNIKDIKMSNPYATMNGATESPNDTLAYNIINNAKLNKNGTSLVNTPLTKPAVEAPTFSSKYEKAKKYGQYTEYNVQNYYITYASDYSINETTGSFTLINPSAPTKYSDIADKSVLLGKYIVYPSTSSSSQTTNNINYIYQISKTLSKVTDSSYEYHRILSVKKSTEKELSVTQDDYGTSYYFRGGVEDNYLNYSGMCWRIVRIEGDGSIKLILADPEEVCSSSSSTNGTLGEKSQDEMLNTLDKFLLGESYSTWPYSSEYEGYVEEIRDYNPVDQTKLKSDTWCIGDRTSAYNVTTGALLTDAEKEQIAHDGDNYYYKTGKRLYGIGETPNATLKCEGETFESKIGTLTADETVFAGATTPRQYNNSFYLVNAGGSFWSLSLSSYDQHYEQGFYLDSFGSVFGRDTGEFDTFEFTAAITLVSGTKIVSGDGTLTKPYVVKMD